MNKKNKFKKNKLMIYCTNVKILRNIVRDKELLLLMMIPFAYYIIFHYQPMYGMIIAFKDYSISRGILRSEWVGLKWFMQFFNSFYFHRLLKNTFVLSIYQLVFGFPVPIIFALLVNEVKNKNYKKAVQTITYLPHFISIVVVVGMMVNFLSPNEGVVNLLLEKLGFEYINFMSEPAWFRFLYVGSGIWQNFGFGSIIYLAAIAGIPQELYEAATIDGANRMQKIYFITLPSILPTITILLIMNLGGMLNIGFEKVMLMYSPGVYEKADVIQTYVYRRGIQGGDYSFAAAVGFFNSVVNFTLIVTFNKISKYIGQNSLW